MFFTLEVKHFTRVCIFTHKMKLVYGNKQESCRDLAPVLFQKHSWIILQIKTLSKKKGGLFQVLRDLRAQQVFKQTVGKI